MDIVVTTYLVYLLLSVGLTVWVGRTLSRNGALFLVDVFHGDRAIADAVNRLLVVGFYLLNLGFVTLALQTDDVVRDARTGIELLSSKMGAVAIVLGVVHLFNVFVFTRLRRRAQAPAAAPVAVPAGAGGAGPWAEPAR